MLSCSFPGDAAVRHSVAFFTNCTYTAPVACLPSCCAPADGRPPARFPPITAGEYILGRLGLIGAG